MTFDRETAAIRFGTGLSPTIAPPASISEMLDQLGREDEILAQYPVPTFAQMQGQLGDIRRLLKIRRADRNSPEAKAASKTIRGYRKQSKVDQAIWLRNSVARNTLTQDGFRERLVRFWADHFTVKGKQGVMRRLASTFVEGAIRPNVSLRFADLLKAVTLHPMMLTYLDQTRSAGPNSVAAKRAKRGLNENLAREVLELHSLGVDGAYSQQDVRELAELLTGLSYTPGEGFKFVENLAEPGAETVLGQSYGGGEASLNDVEAFLEDLAIHPETARHLAWKLVVHFVSDTPDPAQVAHVAQRFQDSKGALLEVYDALLEHPSSWQSPDQKVKQPFDFISSSLRACGVEARRFNNLKPKDSLRIFAAPLQIMGQSWENPKGPDGWEEEAQAWITPQGLAGRIQWAMIHPTRLNPKMPDPRDFVDLALGRRASAALRFAAESAESRKEGIGLVLVSPEFQKR